MQDGTTRCDESKLAVDDDERVATAVRTLESGMTEFLGRARAGALDEIDDEARERLNGSLDRIRAILDETLEVLRDGMDDEPGHGSSAPQT